MSPRSPKSPTDTGRRRHASAIEQLSRSRGPWWLHIDLDVLDPVEFPAQGCLTRRRRTRRPGRGKLDRLVMALFTGPATCVGGGLAIHDPEQDPTAPMPPRVTSSSSGACLVRPTISPSPGDPVRRADRRVFHPTISAMSGSRWRGERSRNDELRNGSSLPSFGTAWRSSTLNSVVVSLDLTAAPAGCGDRQGYYAIGSSGREGNAAVGGGARPTDPAFLHYRSGGFFLARAGQAGGRDPFATYCLGSWRPPRSQIAPAGGQGVRAAAT